MDVEKIFGDDGHDQIAANDGVKDIIDCGRGSDTVATADAQDQIAGNCENQP